ncbi:MAG: CoA transferase [Betaproteobacteria bacterium]|nr:CoA transferase [Betaproteobacteria bacterium]
MDNHQTPHKTPHKTPETNRIGPLSGVRVLDLSAYIAGPYGCSLLADQGAEVIKIEPPVGDNLRKYPSTLATESRAFLGVNRSKKSGEGQYVGVSLLRSALTMQSARLVWADSEPREVGRDMRSGGITGIHPTREGYIYISANTVHFWQALCEKTGLTDLLDERYDSVRKRAQHQTEIVPKLRQALATRTALEWEAHFGEDVPCSAARSVEDMFDFPQVLAEDMVQRFDHPVVGSYRGFTRGWAFGRTPGPDPFAAPVLDQHGDELRAEADRLGRERETGQTKEFNR